MAAKKKKENFLKKKLKQISLRDAVIKLGIMKPEDYDNIVRIENMTGSSQQ